MKSVVTALILALSAPPVSAAEWPNTPANRWQAIAEMQTLNAQILGSRSATFSLEHWCEAHHLAENPRLFADVVRDAPVKPLTADQRKRLQISDTEPFKYRLLKLRCGSKVVSEADNWYVPARLTAEMNTALETTDTPFGRAIKDLMPYRLTFEALVHWNPPLHPEGASLTFAPILFEHRAVLYRASDQAPISEVDEHYQAAVLDFSPAE